MGFQRDTITYAAAADDWGAAIVRLRRGWWWSPILWLFPLVVGLVGAYEFVLGDWALAVGLGSGAAIMFAGYNSARVNGWLVKRQLKSLVGQTATITLADDGLHFVAGPSTGSLAWSAVYDVIDDRRVVIITRDKAVSWAIIPRATFADEREVEAFRAVIRRRRDEARGVPG